MNQVTTETEVAVLKAQHSEVLRRLDTIDKKLDEITNTLPNLRDALTTLGEQYLRQRERIDKVEEKTTDNEVFIIEVKTTIKVLKYLIALLGLSGVANLILYLLSLAK